MKRRLRSILKAKEFMLALFLSFVFLNIHIVDFCHRQDVGLNGPLVCVRTDIPVVL